ncbi:hypothetical protein KCU99_g37, partial [Aureobasidium melanogenum]
MFLPSPYSTSSLSSLSLLLSRRSKDEKGFNRPVSRCHELSGTHLPYKFNNMLPLRATLVFRSRRRSFDRKIQRSHGSAEHPPKSERSHLPSL